MASTRQLAAIMFTDIAGYTAIMGEDEQKAFDLLRLNRQIQQPLIKKFKGSWIKEIGDGVLASFYTVTDAVLCAITIQQSCQKVPDLKLRIGIHLGEVLVEDNDIFGDGVNIASRIQALAPAGGVWVSFAVNNIVANKKEFKTQYVGEEILKNVKEPVQIFQVDLNHFSREPVNADKFQKQPAYNPVKKSIAVLPFVNMSNDPEQEYFSDGMAEEIINSLSHLKDLKTAGRTSSFQFKGKNLDMREIGEKLGVSNVLEGSVRKQGNKLRVTAQLINVEDGFHLWSEKYDRNIDDIFAIQDEIALSITEKLKITFFENDEEIIRKAHTQNTVAYELYLKGRFYLNKRGAGLVAALNFFQQAIDIDPDFALAYAGYADTNLLFAAWGLARPEALMKKAKKAADKALDLDPSLCQPYCSLGYYYTCYEWNWIEAKKNFLRSIELNPGYSQAYYWYGWNYLCWIEGSFQEAEKNGRIAIQQEPLSAICYGTYSLILHSAGKFKEALEASLTGIELDPGSFICRLSESNTYMALQEYDKAIESLEKTTINSNRHHFLVNGLIWNHCLKGNLEIGRELMNELKKRSEKEYISNTYTGLSAAYLNDIDEAFYYLEKAFNDREPILLCLKNEYWAPPSLRNDQRFQNLLARIKFPA